MTTTQPITGDQLQEWREQQHPAAIDEAAQDMGEELVFRIVAALDEDDWQRDRDYLRGGARRALYGAIAGWLSDRPMQNDYLAALGYIPWPDGKP